MFKLSRDKYIAALESAEELENTLWEENENLGLSSKNLAGNWWGTQAEMSLGAINTSLEVSNHAKALAYTQGMTSIMGEYKPEIEKLMAKREQIGQQLKQDEYVEPDLTSFCENELIIDYDYIEDIKADVEGALLRGDAAIEILEGMINDAEECAGEYLNLTHVREMLEEGRKKLHRLENYRDEFVDFGKKMADLEYNMSMDLSNVMREQGDTAFFANPMEGMEKELLASDKLQMNIDSVSDIEVLKNMYGLTEQQAQLWKKAIEQLGESCPYEKNSPAYINYIYGTLSTLCISYNSTRWRMTTGQPNVWQAKNRLYLAGLSKQEILDLQVTINLQHGDFTNENLRKNDIDIESSSFSDETFMKMQRRCTDSNNDFAHQVVQIAAFAYGDMIYEDNYVGLSRYLIDLFNSKDFQNSYTDYEISFKGDIDSGRYSEADFQSDVDAINIYTRMKNNETESIQEIWKKYYCEIENGNINRAEELFQNLGNGETDIGILALQDILDEETIGSLYIQDEKSEEEQTEAKQIFIKWLFSEYYNLEYDFPKSN